MKLLIFLLCFMVCTDMLFAKNVLRFRGENSQGKYEESGLLPSWPEEGLEPKWIADDLGAGWSSVVKAGNRLYLNSLDTNDRKKESVICLNLEGKKLWQSTTGTAWKGSYPEARMTPTYVPRTKSRNARLVVLTGNGEAVCLSASTGQVHWKKDVAQIYETRFGRWGVCESPVVHNGTVFLTVCGEKASVVALSVLDGSVIWEAEPVDGMGAYVTPILFENQLIAMTAEYILGLDVQSGKILWQIDYKNYDGKPMGYGIHCNTPLLRGNRFFITSGYDQKGIMCEILPNAEGVKILWTTDVLDVHHGNAVEVDGRIYGSNWLNNSTGNWVCLDWETGETIYEEPWEKLGKGATIYADGRLYLYEEKRGTLGLAVPGDRLNVVSHFRVTFGTQQHWAHPVICDGILYVRHGTSLAAFDIHQEGKEKS